MLDSLISSLRPAELYERVDKTLNVAITHREVYNQKSARPYFALDSGWGFTTLDTGEYFFVNTSDRNLAPWILLGGHWERNVTRVLLSYAQPGMVVVDVGAHMGYYTVRLGTRVGISGRVLAFEPNPEVAAVCLENVKINGLSSHVTLHRCALGDKVGTATLTRSHSNMTGANLVGVDDADYSVEVPVCRLDDIVDGSISADLMKIDAEGYEPRILGGARALLARSPNCAIMLELGLEKWERFEPLSSVVEFCGGGARELFAVQEDGTLTFIPSADLRLFLERCAFHESYFLIARRDQVSDLLERSPADATGRSLG